MSEHVATIDDVRKFWNRLPCNVLDSRREHGTRPYFDEIEARKYAIEPDIPPFAQFARWKGRKVLEIGCGIGTDSINFARAGADLTVADVSEKSLELCKQRFQVYGLTARFFLANAEALSQIVPVEPYDLVYSFGVLHHTPRPDRAFREIQKYLSRDSELRVMLYSKWSWNTFWIVCRNGKGAFWWAADLIRTYSEAQQGCPVTYCYSFREVRRLLKAYRIREIRKAYFFSDRLFQYTSGRCEPRWFVRWLPSGVFRWVEQTLGWHTLVVATLSRNAPAA